MWNVSKGRSRREHGLLGERITPGEDAGCSQGWTLPRFQIRGGAGCGDGRLSAGSGAAGEGEGGRTTHCEVYSQRGNMRGEESAVVARAAIAMAFKAEKYILRECWFEIWGCVLFGSGRRWPRDRMGG